MAFVPDHGGAFAPDAYQARAILALCVQLDPVLEVSVRAHSDEEREFVEEMDLTRGVGVAHDMEAVAARVIRPDDAPPSRTRDAAVADAPLPTTSPSADADPTLRQSNSRFGAPQRTRRSAEEGRAVLRVLRGLRGAPNREP